MRFLYPGTRVKVFDWRLYKDDQTTPLSMTVRKGTVIQWYGKRSEHGLGIYPDLVDVRFDHRPNEISHGHFSNGVEVL